MLNKTASTSNAEYRNRWCDVHTLQEEGSIIKLDYCAAVLHFKFTEHSSGKLHEVTITMQLRLWKSKYKILKINTMSIAPKDYSLDEWEYYIYIYGPLYAQHNNIRCLHFCLLLINQTKERKQQNGFLLWLEQKEKGKKRRAHCLIALSEDDNINHQNPFTKKEYILKWCWKKLHDRNFPVTWPDKHAGHTDSLACHRLKNYIPNHQPSGSTLVMVLWSAGGRNGRPVCKHQHHLRTTHTLCAFQLPVKNKWINLYQTQK